MYLSDVKSVDKEVITCAVQKENLLSQKIIEHRPLTLKVDEDDQVIILEVIAAFEIKVPHEAIPAQRITSVAITGRIIPPYLGGIVPKPVCTLC